MFFSKKKDTFIDALVIFVREEINKLKSELDEKVGGRIVALEDRLRVLENEKEKTPPAA